MKTSQRKVLIVLLLVLFNVSLYAQKVGFSQAHGFFETSFELSLSSNLENAEIRYTLDGSTPEVNSGLLYQNEIDITTTSIVRAIAFNEEDTSSVKTQSYLFLNDVITQLGVPSGYPTLWTETLPGDYDMDPEIVDDPQYGPHLQEALTQIPSISIVTDIPHLFDEENGIYTNSTESGIEWERPTSIEMIYPDGTEGFTENAGLRMYGNSSREPAETPKHSFRLLFKEAYGDTKLNYPLFGQEASKKFDTFILRAGFNFSWLTDQDYYNQRDGALYLRDMFARDVQLSMGYYASNGRFVHLYLNGLYWGLYNIAERPDASFAAEYLGGDKTEYDVLNSGFEVGESDRDAYDTLLHLTTDFNLSDQTNYENAINYLDLNNFIDYMILNHYIGNLNWDDHNWYAARKKEANAPWTFFAWDSETSFFRNYINMVDASFENYPTEMFQSLRDNEEFRIAFADRVHQQFFNCGSLTVDSVALRWDRLAALIDQAIIGESARWGDYRRDVHLVNPAELYTKATWLTERQRIADDFTPVRTDTVLNRYITGDLYPSLKAPLFSEPCDTEVPDDFTLTITNPNDNNEGRIWLTIDGTDPRSFGGGIDDDAIDGDDSYSLDIENITTVKARIFKNGEWSAMQVTTYFPDVSLSDVLFFNELMYNPTGGTEDEFVELKNASPHILDLSGVQITGGIDYQFPHGSSIPANGFLILAEDSLSFVEKFNTPVFGQYAGKLSNSGETLILRNGINAIFNEVTYQDTPPWNEDPDGKGTSLELRVDFENNALPSEWLASADIGGSPNAENRIREACGLPNPPVVINEINYNSSVDFDPGDWIELYNPSDEIIDLNGWQLQDEGGSFEIPAGTNILANSWLLLIQEEDKFTTVFPTVEEYLSNLSFGFSSNGERLRLVSAGGCLVDSVRYNDQLPWPVEADGDGRTLQLVDPLLDNADGTNWTISTAAFGTPGAGPLKAIDLGPDQLICEDQPLVFDLTDPTCTTCTYLWNDNNTEAVRTIEIMNTSSFSVTVTNAYGESSFDEVTVSIVPSPTIAYDDEMPTCFGADDGSIVLDVSGGSGSYEYLWNNGLTSLSLQNISAGIYNVTVTDLQNCTAIEQINISEPAELVLEVMSSPVSCYGTVDGQIELITTGGSGNYEYLWEGGMSIPVLTNLAAGIYQVTVTDDQQCTMSKTIVITEPDEITLPATVDQLDCANEASASINIHDGGLGDFDFEWSTGATTEDVYNLSAGNYEVTITNATNCQTVQTYQIVAPDAIEVVAMIAPTSCNLLDNGSISVDASGGTGDLTYLWDNNNELPTLDNIMAGTYTLTITDENSCILVESFEVTEIEGLHLGGIVADISCHGLTDGSINLTPNGGVGAYTIQWSTGSSNEDLQNLAPGSYIVTVSDENGCSNEESFVVESPNALAMGSSIIDVNCFSGSDGMIDLTLSGGTLPYSFQWNTGATEEDLEGLPSGSYSVTILDGNDCSREETFTIEAPNALEVSSSIIDVNCFSGSDGMIDLTPSGGTLPYSFQWNTGATEEDLQDLPSGDYSVTILDGNDCSREEIFTIDAPMEIETDSEIAEINCFNGMDGSIDLTPDGGTPPYSFNWNTGDTTEGIFELSAGTYEVIIEDAKECSTTVTFELNAPTELEVEAEPTSVSCFGFADGQLMVSPEGGTAPYDILWSNGSSEPTVQNLSAGMYTLTLTDQNNCQLEIEYTIDGPEPLTFVPIVTDPLNGNDGSIELLPEGGTAPYEINWSNGETGDLLEGLSAGQYSFELTDANNCSLSDSLTILSTGIDELEQIRTLNIYPNPGTGHFVLDCSFDRQQNVSIQIYNALGQKLIQQNTEGTVIHFPFNLNEQANGLYFVHLSWNEGQKRTIQQLVLAR